MATKGKVQIEIRAKDDASAQMGKIGKSTEAMSATFKKAGLAITAMGVAMAAALTMCIKAAAEEQAGITKLSVALGNMGIQYDEVRESLEKWINTQQQKTAISDTAQRDSLSKLILMTGDLAKAQDLLTVVMDVAVGTGKDLESVTTLIGYALSGNWGMVTRMIPALKAATTEEERWLMLRQMFLGQAEAYGQTVAGQFQLLKNNIGDIKEAIGSVLLPVLKDLSDKIMPIIEGIKAWIAENPELTETIVKAGLALTALTMVGGPMLLMIGYLPMITKGLHTMTAAFAALKAVAWEVYLVLGAIAYVILGLSAILKGKWPTLKNIIAEAKWVASYWMETLTAAAGIKFPEVPEMQKGGIVPGPIGAPVPIIAHGGEPFGGIGGKAFGDVHIHIGSFMGDEASLRAFSRKLKEIMGQDVRRTSFSGINRLEYFPGSSSV